MLRIAASVACCLLTTSACSSATPASNLRTDTAGAPASAIGGTAAGATQPAGGVPGGGGEGGLAPARGGPADLAGVTNARFVGQLTTDDGRRMRPRVLLRSGDLASIVDCSGLAAWNVKSVIDLRDLEHPDYVPDVECVLATTRFYQADLPRLLPPSADAYYDTLVAAEPRLAAIFAHLAADDALPGLIHCVIGRDRASLILSLVLLAIGVPRSQVLEDMTTNQDAGIVIDAAWMDRVLARIDEAGGTLAYLEAHGVTQAQIEALREQALLP